MPVEDLFAAHPFARFLGIAIEAGPPMMVRLPFRADLVGNPMIPALHGGVIGAFMEITAVAQLALDETFIRPPKPVNVSIQYLRTGKPTDTFARARVRRIGRTVASVEAFAWQDDAGQPIATLQAHFLLGQAEAESPTKK